MTMNPNMCRRFASGLKRLARDELPPKDAAEIINLFDPDGRFADAKDGITPGSATAKRVYAALAPRLGGQDRRDLAEMLGVPETATAEDDDGERERVAREVLAFLADRLEQEDLDTIAAMLSGADVGEKAFELDAPDITRGAVASDARRRLAHDAKADKDFAARFPEAARIGRDPLDNLPAAHNASRRRVAAQDAAADADFAERYGDLRLPGAA